jgi:hypothetical protein
MRPSRAPCRELKRAASRLELAALLLGLSACASAPPTLIEASAMTLPTAWAAAPDQVTGAGLEAQWWARFNDPVLTDLVISALQANHSIQAALDALRQALALRDVAAAGLRPNLEASGQRSAGAGNRFAASLDASWELDLFGARHSALAVSQATARASAAGLAEVQVSIAAEVGLAYLTLRGAQAQLRIAQDKLASKRPGRSTSGAPRPAWPACSMPSKRALPPSRPPRNCRCCRRRYCRPATHWPCCPARRRPP